MLENNEKNKLEEIHILKQQNSEYKLRIANMQTEAKNNKLRMLENNQIIELEKKLEEIPILKQQISKYEHHIVNMKEEIKGNKVESDTQLYKKDKMYDDLGLKEENKKLEEENRTMKKTLQKRDDRLKAMGKTVKEEFCAKNKELDALKNNNDNLTIKISEITLEKDNLQKKLKSERKLVASAKNERKLMSRSWYSLALEHHRLLLSSKSKRNSWLNQQREHTGLTS